MQSFLSFALIAIWAGLLLNVLVTLTLVRRVNSLTAIFTHKPDLAVGQPAPAFEAETLAHEPVSLVTFANRNVLFVFIHPDCRACRNELPLLQRLALIAKHHANIELVLVSEGNEIGTQALVDEFNITTLVVSAPRESNSFARDYNPNGENPCYCLVDAQGRVISKAVVGSREWLSLTQALEASVSG
jgi:peroxiredoxin